MTARKRDERVIDVPMAITVFSGESLDLRGINTLSEVLQDVPSRGVIDDGAAAAAVILVRGVATTTRSNDLSYYLDEMPFTGITVPVEPDIRSWDIERVEVLRGPQGTLFGEGSMSGTVRIITHDPQLNEWDAKSDTQVSGTSGGGVNQVYKGLVNIPLVDDRLALRLAATKEMISGWADDPVTGQTNLNSQDIVTYRAKLLFRPVEALTLSASWWHYDGRFPRGDSTTQALNEPQYEDLLIEMKYDLGGLTARYDLGPVVAIYSFSHNSLAAPQSGTAFGVGALSNGTDVGVTSHELRFSGGSRESLQWTAGLYAGSANRHDFLSIAASAVDDTTTTHTRSEALFGEATYRLPGFPVDFSAGARFVRDSLAGYSTSAGTPTAPVGRTYPNFDPRLSASWHPNPNMLLYTSAAKGYRSGQLQSNVALTVAAESGIHLPAIVQDDSVWMYEIGTKVSLGERLFVEGDLYHSRWDHPPVLVRLPVAGIAGLVNFGGTTSNGVEASLTLMITRAWSLTIGGGYADAKYALSAADSDVAAGYLARDGSTVTTDAALEWHQPVFGGLTGIGRLGVRHTSARPLYSIGGALTLPGDPLTVLEARLGVQRQRWTAFLFADNLTNDRGAAAPRIVVPAPGGFETDAPRLEPRIVGLEFTIGLR